VRDYFKRQIELWGEEKQNSLQNRKIAIIGCGGLGCSLGLSLGSSGIGEICLVDFDKVENHNIHRQIAFKLDDEGEYKAKALSNLINSRCKFVKATPFVEDFETFSKRDISFDLIIDATDNLRVRSEIDGYAKSKNTPWIYGSVEEFNAQICFFERGDFNSFKISDRKPKGIAAPMVMTAASFQANLAIRYLIGNKIEKDILHYIYFDQEGKLTIQKLKMPQV
jgi:molybdopterin/thiamine biosynthesis adenylyltransferase